MHLERLPISSQDDLSFVDTSICRLTYSTCTVRIIHVQYVLYMYSTFTLHNTCLLYTYYDTGIVHTNTITQKYGKGSSYTISLWHYQVK